MDYVLLLGEGNLAVGGRVLCRGYMSVWFIRGSYVVCDETTRWFIRRGLCN